MPKAAAGARGLLQRNMRHLRLILAKLCCRPVCLDAFQVRDAQRERMSERGGLTIFQVFMSLFLLFVGPNFGVWSISTQV
jgi:hypothetical protein